MEGADSRRRPVIGLTVDFLPARGWFKYTVYDRYVESVRDAGGFPVVLPPEPADVGRQLELVDGIVLPGGDDLDPSLWGEEKVAGNVPSDPRRTAHELALVTACMANAVPVFGVCLGLQLMNVARGGSLIQELPPGPVLHQDANRGLALRHDVEVSPGSVLARSLGLPAGGIVSVNSSHHQAPGRLGEGFVVSAVARDGTIEALELPEHPFCLGVQWHPDVELRQGGDSARLFEAFVAACGRRAG